MRAMADSAVPGDMTIRRGCTDLPLPREAVICWAGTLPVGTDKRDELSACPRAMQKWLGMREGQQPHRVSPPGEPPAEVEGRCLPSWGAGGDSDLLVERTMIGLASRHIDCSFRFLMVTGKPVRCFLLRPAPRG